MIYSIINTAEANGLNIREYLTKVFTHPGRLILPLYLNKSLQSNARQWSDMTVTGFKFVLCGIILGLPCFLATNIFSLIIPYIQTFYETQISLFINMSIIILFSMLHNSKLAKHMSPLLLLLNTVSTLSLRDNLVSFNYVEPN